MELRLEAIINSLDDAIVSVDENERVIFLNDAAARLFRCERHQVVGQPVAQVPELADVVGQLHLKELAHSESERAVRRLQGRRRSGETFPMEAMVTSASVHGRSYCTAVIRDVSLQQQMQRALFQSRKAEAIGALANGIAHDFNNIFTAILSHLDLAIFARELPASLKENLIYAKASASRGAEWVSQLQAFSRLSKSQTAPLDLGGLIEQVVFILRRSVDSGIQIQYAKPAVRPWLVHADGDQILQVVINLCLNARDAMPDGGQLTIQVDNVSCADAAAQPPAKAGDFVRLVVRDTGEGMRPEVLQRLFEPYFTTKEVGQGVGLGLSIAYSVITEHGGWMEVESQLGQGTEFHVFLPRSASAEDMTGRRHSVAVDPKTVEGRERILVVDDEELVRMVIRAVLAYRGYQVFEAVNGEDALEKYFTADPPFDLVLMDLHMPSMNGRDALLEIRKRAPNARAILLSGGVGEKDCDTVLALKGVEFLHKPFENHELACLVRQTLDATGKAEG